MLRFNNLTYRRLTGYLALIVLVILNSGCATQAYLQKANAGQWAYTASTDKSLFARHAPIIVTGNEDKRFDRIGQVSARIDADGNEQLYVDPTTSVFYVQRQDFSTPRGVYTNLIYRIHFPQVPYSLVPFHISAGNNGGLFIILTLDNEQRLLLVTTVHTCGCYVAIVPTSYLPDAALPDGWSGDTQTVFGEVLPRRLQYQTPSNRDERLVISLNSGTHRVRDIRLDTLADISVHRRLQRVKIAPMDTLLNIPLGDDVTSFYYLEGSKQGYVKNANKPFELLFMSWWMLDANVGVDKRLGDQSQTGTVFYTSLKPWNRQASNLWRFADFLSFWGWKL